MWTHQSNCYGAMGIKELYWESNFNSKYQIKIPTRIRIRKRIRKSESKSFKKRDEDETSIQLQCYCVTLTCVLYCVVFVLMVKILWFSFSCLRCMKKNTCLFSTQTV